MAIPCSNPTLLAEFKHLLDELETEDELYCRATLPKHKDRRCAKVISKSNKLKLENLFSSMIAALENGQTDVETKLEIISSLVMCQRPHQPRAAAQKQQWLDMIERPDKPKTPKAAQATTDTVPNKRVDSARTIGGPSKGSRAAANNYASRRSRGSSDLADEGFDEPDCDSEDDEEQIKAEDASEAVRCALPRAIKSEYTDDDPFTTTKKLRPPVKSEDRKNDRFITPKKPLQQFFVDSGVSMGTTTPQHSYDLSNVDDEPPSSPLDKVSKQRAQRAKQQKIRPSPTPLQPAARELGKKPAEADGFVGHESTFKRFRQPSSEMIKCIKKPLGKYNMVEGYLYVFQISGPSYYKIGYANKRNKKTMEKSFEARMGELRKTWPDLTVVFQCRLPHAQRAEQILHKYFDGRRLNETTCERASKEKGSGCNHRTHKEWFNVPLNEIWKVASAWCHWIRSNPYPLQIGAKRYISQDWITKLDAFDCTNDLGLDAGYYWLEWLRLHIPESHSLEGLDIMELSKIKRGLERLRKEQESKDGVAQSTEKPAAAAVGKYTLSVADIPEGPSIQFLCSPIKQGTWTAPETFEKDEELRHRTMRWVLRHLPGRRQ